MSLIGDYEKWKSGYLDRCAERGKELLQQYIRKEHYDSGNMYMSCTWMPVNENTRRITTDPLSHTNGVHYAPIVRDGRKGFSVKPPKKALRFYSKGELYYRRSVGPYEGDPNLEKDPYTQLCKEVSKL